MSIADPTLEVVSGADLSQVERVSVDMVQLAPAGPHNGGAFEPTQVSAAAPLVTEPEAARERAAPEAPALPFVSPVLPPLLRRLVSGRYRSAGAIQLELRVDVDGARPTHHISGDFYITAGATLNYFGSFIVNAPAVNITPTTVTIEGIGSYTWSAGAPKIRVTIPRHLIFQPPGAASVQFFTLTNQPGASYLCPFQSRFFRTVEIEEDRVASVTPFVSYDTGSLPSGGPARVLTIAQAYAEAGVEMLTAGISNVVPDNNIGPSWSNAELHAAMQNQFSLWANLPQWMVWLFTARLHDLGPGLLGIMFDQQGRQRQGCADFHASLAGTTPDRLRSQLYTCVHELGHCFNLFHSFHKEFMNPPQPNRLGALSWMNYPQGYQPSSGPGGSAAFWSAFPFRFDDLELVHLRHAFRDNIIMGGNPFGTGAALIAPEVMMDPVEDNSGLRLQLEARSGFALGEPVVVEIKLETTDTRGKGVAPYIHPNMGFVQIAIRKPGGEVVLYEPLIEHCVAPETITLSTTRPSIYDSAYLGYGKGGYYFDHVGPYRLRAIYQAPDGSRVVSNVVNLRVRHPITAEDEQVAELLMGEDQGAMLYLLGSDSPTLKVGQEAVETLLNRYRKHPLAVYARLVRGMQLGREFKTISPDRELKVRPPDNSASAALLSDVTEASIVGNGVDNITLNQVMRQLARVQDAAGKEKEAKATAQRMVEHFRKQELPSHVMALIERQAASFAERNATPADATIVGLVG